MKLQGNATTFVDEYDITPLIWGKRFPKKQKLTLLAPMKRLIRYNPALNKENPSSRHEKQTFSANVISRTSEKPIKNKQKQINLKKKTNKT